MRWVAHAPRVLTVGTFLRVPERGLVGHHVRALIALGFLLRARARVLCHQCLAETADAQEALDPVRRSAGGRLKG